MEKRTVHGSPLWFVSSEGIGGGVQRNDGVRQLESREEDLSDANQEFGDIARHDKGNWE